MEERTFHGKEIAETNTFERARNSVWLTYESHEVERKNPKSILVSLTPGKVVWATFLILFQAIK